NVDVLLVIGSANSSNAIRLVEVAQTAGTRAYLINDVGDIRAEWLQDARRIGVTAGASTPEVLVTQTVQALRGQGVAVRGAHAVDLGVEGPNLGDQLALEGDRLGPKAVDLDRQARVDAVDLLVETDDLLIEHADVSAECVQLGGDDVLECLLDLVVDTHGPHSIRSTSVRQRPPRGTL